MAGAHGDTLFAEQVSQVGVVYAVDAEAGQRRLRRAEQAHAGACLQAAQQGAVQGALVGRHGVRIQGAKPAQHGAEGDHRADRRGAGFETQRRRTEAGLLVVGVLHHLAAELPVLQPGQGCAAAVEQADAIRAVQLVRRADVEVAAQRLHVGALMHRALGAVDHAQRALGAGHGQQLRQRLPAAEHVGQLGHGQQAGARADARGSLFQVDAATGVQRQHDQLQVATPGQLLPGQQVGVVFGGADDDLPVARQLRLEAIGEQVE